MTMISDHIGNRDNNFNLLRFFAAFAVVLTHSVVVVFGDGTIEILKAETGYTLGHYAVNIFFIISGFLVTQSMVKSQSIISYLSARMMRIIPALFVMTILAALVLGPIVTSLPLAQYFTNPATWLYIPTTTSLLVDDLNLPGVFMSVPFDDMLNVPLWTIRWEIMVYLLVVILYFIGFLASKAKFGIFFIGFMALYIVVTAFTNLRETIGPVDHALRLGSTFLIGAALFMYRDKIRLNIFIAIALWLVVIAVKSTFLYQLSMFFAMSYSIFWIAYVPKGRLLLFNKLGDFSYGIYIFGFPLQQLVIWSMPNVNPMELFVYSSIIILVFASASYYIIEKPAMKKHKVLASWFKYILLSKDIELKQDSDAEKTQSVESSSKV